MTMRNSSRQELDRRKEPEKQTEAQPRRKEEKPWGPCVTAARRGRGICPVPREVSGTEAKLLLKFLVIRELLVT